MWFLSILVCIRLKQLTVTELATHGETVIAITEEKVGGMEKKDVSGHQKHMKFIQLTNNLLSLRG
jgi:hypothetical protein